MSVASDVQASNFMRISTLTDVGIKLEKLKEHVDRAINTASPYVDTAKHESVIHYIFTQLINSFPNKTATIFFGKQLIEEHNQAEATSSEQRIYIELWEDYLNSFKGQT